MKKLVIAVSVIAKQHSSRSFVRAANACSHRTFVRSAEACMDISELPLDVRIAGAPTSARGNLTTMQLDFSEPARLELELGDKQWIVAEVSAVGEASAAAYRADGHETPARMVRVSAH